MALQPRKRQRKETNQSHSDTHTRTLTGCAHREKQRETERKSGARQGEKTRQQRPGERPPGGVPGVAGGGVVRTTWSAQVQGWGGDGGGGAPGGRNAERPWWPPLPSPLLCPCPPVLCLRPVVEGPLCLTGLPFTDLLYPTRPPHNPTLHTGPPLPSCCHPLH